MFKDYFKTAWRTLWKNKFCSGINISGLAVGLAAAFMLLMLVKNELSYDKFNTDYQHIYRLSSQMKSNGEYMTWDGCSRAFGNFCEIYAASSINNKDTKSSCG